MDHPGGGPSVDHPGGGAERGPPRRRGQAWATQEEGPSVGHPGGGPTSSELRKEAGRASSSLQNPVPCRVVTSARKSVI